MLYQIALTRVLSVVVWYHFAFLTISLVMLGLGAPGIWLADRKGSSSFLPFSLIAGGITVPLSIIVVIQSRPLSTLTSLPLVMIIILGVLPATLSLGASICLLLMRAPGSHVSRMYGADLAGAAVGALTVIPLMTVLPTPHLAAGTALFPLACALGHGTRWARWAAVVGALVVISLVQGGAYQVHVNKVEDESLRTRLAERWTPLSRLTVFQENSSIPFTWGAGAATPEFDDIDQLWLEQDGSAGTPITHFNGDLTSVGHLFFDVTTVGYQVRPAQRVAIIGGGGGRDILSALVGGATDIDAIELNTATIDLVSNEFGTFSGDIYHHPHVHAFASEGRSHLTHSTDRFDLIQISLIDSWAASAAGAFALAENNLYTLEAFQLFRAKLTDRGMIATSRWTSELPRLLALARAALEEDGLDPASHLALVATDKSGTLLTSKTPFTPADVERLQAICAQRGFDLVHPAAADGPRPHLRRLIEQGVGHLAATGLNMEPPTDDSPYFFHAVSPFRIRALVDDDGMTGLDFNLDAARMLQSAIVSVTSLAVFLFLLPFVSNSATRWGTSNARLARSSVYFALIGGAFMLLENMLLQHFVLYLGHPSYATTVILATLLVGMGLGSTFAGSVGVERLQRFGFVVPIGVTLLILGLPTLIGGTLGQPLSLRIVMSCVLLTPLGAVLGLFFPLGMVRFGDEAKPWLWAVNGIFGVVASVMSLALSMEFGFSWVGLLAALGYVGAWLAVRPGR